MGCKLEKKKKKKTISNNQAQGRPRNNTVRSLVNRFHKRHHHKGLEEFRKTKQVQNLPSQSKS